MSAMQPLKNKNMGRAALPYIALAAAVFAAYGNVFSNGFMLDDFVLVAQNGLLRHWHDVPRLLGHLSLYGSNLPGGFYRPVQELLFFFIYQAFGLSAAAFHAVNIVLQVLAACLAYLFGRRVGFGAFASFAAALIWGVHPLNTEAVDYISGSADPLYVIFTLAGLLSLLPDFAPRAFWKAGLFFMLALGSKESAIVFPALAVFTLFLTGDARLKPSTYIRTWPLWLIMALYLVGLHFVYDGHGIMALSASGDTLYAGSIYVDSILVRIFTSLATLPSYLALIVWPTHLHMEREFLVYPAFWAWPVLAGAGMVAAALLQMAWGRGKRGLACTWGLLWFAAAFSPYSGIVKPINALMAEHWMYLPGIGLALGFSQTVAAWIGAKRSEDSKKCAAAALCVAAVFGVMTFHQNRVWHDPQSFYTHIFACGSRSGRAHSSLGQYYFNIGAYTKAKEQFEDALAHPAPLQPLQETVIHMHLAFIALNARPDKRGIIGVAEIAKTLPRARHIAAAVAEFQKTLALDPDYYWAHAFLAVIYDYQGRRDKASFQRRRAREIRRSGRNINALL